MKRRNCLIALLAIVGIASQALAGHKRCAEKACCPKAEIQKEEKSCWKVEGKEVCIPRVRFPWSKCPTPRCGKVRTVHVLKNEKYEVEKCSYKWEVEGD